MSEGTNPFLYGSDPSKNATPVNDGSVPHNPRSRKILTIVLAVAAMVLVVVIFSLVNNGYTIKNVVINGSSPYTEEQLRAVINEYCEEKNSRSFFYVNADELEGVYSEKLPYLRSVEVEKKYPDTIILTISGEEASCYFAAFDAYYIVNSDLKVLERSESKPAGNGLIEMSIAIPSEISIGKILSFEEGSTMDNDTFQKLYSAIIDSSMRYDVKFLSAENKFELSMVLTSGVDVEIGSVKDVEEKIRTLRKWLDENPSKVSEDLNLDISILKKITVSYD